jgi:AmmeMemoRadiSam system protein A
VPGADEVEHSIEVQLPFLQKTAGPFRLVPLLCGYVAPEDVEPTARAIAPLLGERTLLLASSDFTHYGPNYDFVPFGAPVREQLYGWLTNATWAILRLDQAAWQQHCRERRDTICGQVPISLLIAALARRGSPVRGYLLDAYTSGDVVDDFRNSVSYAAVGFLAVESAEAAATPAARAAAGRDEVKEGTMKTATQGGSGKGFSISAPNQKRLLELARRSIEEFLAYCRDKRVDPREEYRGRDFGKPGPFLKQYLPRVATTVAELAEEEMTRPAAVFVTLTRAGELRGCIGCTEPMGPLREVVPYFAVAAATGDSRFDSMGPMTTQELAKIHVEVSVLSPMQRVKSADDIQPKVHGVVVRRGWHQGLFLPQVWEHFATREGFLAELCLQKAHLDPAAWKDPETELLTFTVFAFEESR